MTELTYATKQVEELLSRIETEKLVLRELIVDKSFSLDDRWALFLKAEIFLGVDSYYPTSLNIITDSPYDDFYLERRETIMYTNLDERMHENKLDAEEDVLEDEYGEKWLRIWAKRDEWREAVLAEGYGGFTFDW